jgi:hypothetical protein
LHLPEGLLCTFETPFKNVFYILSVLKRKTWYTMVCGTTPLLGGTADYDEIETRQRQVRKTGQVERNGN